MRPPVRRFPAAYTRWRHPPFPRRQCEPPRRIRCVYTALPSVTISSQPFCPVSPPGCLRACLGSLTFGCQLNDRRLPFTWRGKPRVFGRYCAVMCSIAGEQPKVCRSAHGDPSNRSLRSKVAPSRRERDGAAGFRRRSGRIPELLRLCKGYASVQLCRSLLSFAFHLATPAISWKRASRRERDAPLQLHAGTARIMV